MSGDTPWSAASVDIRCLGGWGPLITVGRVANQQRRPALRCDGRNSTLRCSACYGTVIAGEGAASSDARGMTVRCSGRDGLQGYFRDSQRRAVGIARTMHGTASRRRRPGHRSRRPSVLLTLLLLLASLCCSHTRFPALCCDVCSRRPRYYFIIPLTRSKRDVLNCHSFSCSTPVDVRGPAALISADYCCTVLAQR